MFVQIFAFLTLFCFSFQFFIFSSSDDITNLLFRIYKKSIWTIFLRGRETIFSIFFDALHTSFFFVQEIIAHLFDVCAVFNFSPVLCKFSPLHISN